MTEIEIKAAIYDQMVILETLQEEGKKAQGEIVRLNAELKKLKAV